MFNLLDIQPHKVSKDLSGYITYIYGAPKTGKTTLAAQMEDAIILAFEKGYNALPGVIAQDITSWSDMKAVVRELKKPEVKGRFKAVVVDTIDIASDMCTKYVCNQKGIESLGDLGYGKGWTAFKEEFNDMFRGLTQLGYAVYFIGHHKEAMTGDEGNQRMVIRPALPNSVRTVIEGMADIYGYAHQVAGHSMSVLTLRHSDDSISCGGRFKYISPEIELSYDNLVNAMRTAIDKEAAEHNGEFVTEEREKPVEVTKLDFDVVMAEFQEVVGKVMQKNPNTNGPKVQQIIERYLGKGKKVNEATPDQVELVNLIVTEIKEDLLK